MKNPTGTRSQPALKARHGTYLQTKHFGSLDGLRFLCIAAVLWHHSPLILASSDLPLIMSRGFLGVDFFFVLSGYLITTLLLREESREGSFSLKGFYWRRALRILPVYFLVVTCVGGYFALIKGNTLYPEVLPFYYLFLVNFLTVDIPLLGPTWSLSVEEQYYVVWPLLLMLIPRRYIYAILIGLIILNVLAVYGLLSAVGIRAFDVGLLKFAMFPTTYAPILMGSSLALLLHYAKSFSFLYKIVGHKVATLVWFALLLAMLQFLPAVLLGLPNLLVHVVMALCLASIVVREDNALFPVLSSRPIARIGQISYGVYLYHSIAAYVAYVGFGAIGVTNPWIVTLGYLVLSFFVSEMSFRYFEQRFLKLRYKTKAN